jgi:hypothetical protein
VNRALGGGWKQKVTVGGPRVGAVGAETHRWTSRCVAFEVRAAEMVASRGCSRSARCEVKRAISQRSSVMNRPTEQTKYRVFSRQAVLTRRVSEEVESSE